MRRREFLVSSSAAATAHALWGGQSPDAARKSRISVMSLDFETSVLKLLDRPDDPKRTLDVMDFPNMIADRFGVHNVEMQHEHFFSTEPAYFQQFLGRVKKAKSRVTQINVEFGPMNICAANPLLRLQTIDLTKRWVDHAVALGCPRVMVNPGTMAPAARPAAIETLKAINGYAKSKKVFITFEPQHATWEAALDVIKAAGIWANPDSKEFRDDADRSKGLHLMYQMTAGNAHFTTGADIACSVKISKEVGYKGLYTIECRHRGDPYQEVQGNIDIVLANL
jgi:hypothetical protein